MSKRQIREDLDNGKRICNKCRKPKKLEEFLKDKRCKLGRSRQCKECANEYRRRTEDKEKAKEYKKEWYKKNKELTIKRQKVRYQKNKKQLQAYGRQHAKDNPEIYKAARHRRRKAVKENGNNDLTAEEIKWLFSNFPYCTYCKTADNLTLDHIIPVSKGGQNTLANIAVACMSCNNDKRAKIIYD